MSGYAIAHAEQLIARLQAQYGLTGPRARELLEEFWRTCACEDEGPVSALAPTERSVMLNDWVACPECKMEHQAWKGNHGRGYAAAGKLYCCQGCYEGLGCECEALADEAYELELQRVAGRRLRLPIERSRARPNAEG